MKSSAETHELERKIKEREIDTVILCAPDILGRLVGTRINAAYLMEKNQWHVRDDLFSLDLACQPIAGCRGAQGNGSLILQPAAGTLRYIPWLPATALVLCDVLNPEGAPIVHGPREILRRQVERAQQQGLRLDFNTRLDCYVLEKNYDEVRIESYRDITRRGVRGQAYNILEGGRQEGLMRAVRTHLPAADVPVEESVSRQGAGQHATSLASGTPMDAADWHVLYKHGMKELATLHDRSATFLAQWSIGLPPSRCIVAASLRCDHAEEQQQLHRRFLAGQLQLAREMCLFFAPFANSYQRFATQGEEFCKLAWKQEDYNAPLRLVGRGREAHLEWEWGGADINPYLAFAAILAAGLHGIEQKLRLPNAGETTLGDIKSVLPSCLGEATDELENSAILREAFGKEAVDHYVAAAKWEIRQQKGAFGSHEFLAWQVQRGFEQA